MPLDFLLRQLLQCAGIELVLVAGVPPAVRVGQELQSLGSGPLTDAQLTALVAELVPDTAGGIGRRHLGSETVYHADGLGQFRVTLTGSVQALHVRVRPARPPVIDQFLQLLVQRGGSDLHLAVGERPAIRVHGDIERIDYAPLSTPQMQHLLNEIMQDKHRAQFTKFSDADFAYAAEGIGRFRVNIFMQQNGPAAVCRTVPSRVPSPDDIGLPPSIRALAQLSQGLVLVTGATGSGKSTTLAALINLINQTRPVHVLTIEDPIEFMHKSHKALVNQREVGRHATSFGRALRAALREDPDVILVGEMRDYETTQLAITAAETGHLVFGTMHTASAAQTINRIVDAFPAAQQNQVRVQLADTLKAVISQQLCLRRDGNGRIAAFEILINNPAVAHLIRKSNVPGIVQTMSTTRQLGMQTMDGALVDLVRRRAIAADEALRSAHDRSTLEQELQTKGLIAS